MNKNSAFTGFFVGNQFRYQEFDLKEIKKLKSGQPISDLDAADYCRLYVTTLKAMNFQDGIPSICFDNFFDFYTRSNRKDFYPEQAGEPL